MRDLVYRTGGIVPLSWTNLTFTHSISLLQHLPAVLQAVHSTTSGGRSCSSSDVAASYALNLRCIVRLYHCTHFSVCRCSFLLDNLHQLTMFANKVDNRNPP